MDLSFASLVEQSSQLMQQEDELPIIEHGAEQIEQVSRKLLSKTQRTLDTTQQAKAHYLLATRGFDAEKYTRNLNSISLATFEPLEPIGDTDIQAYLRHEHEMLILTAIEEAKKNTIAQFNNNYVRGLEADWDIVKRELEAYRPKLNVQESIPMDMKIRSSLGDSYISANRGSSMSKPMKEYGNVVYLLNNSRLQGKPFQVMSSFSSLAASKNESSRKREIVDLWRLLACMTGETQFVDGKFVPSSVVPPEDAYKSSYRKMDLQLRKSFVRGARQFLGAQYYETICSRLARRSVNRAVVPNVIDDIQNYVKYIITPSLNIANPQLLDIDYSGAAIWAVIFYCMRCEFFHDALKVAQNNPKTADFAVFLKEYLSSEDNRLPTNSASRLTSLYRKEFGLRSGVADGDPSNYKKAVFDIVCRCDVSTSVLEDRTYVHNIQDYMWLELALTREKEMDNANETHYSLHHLQTKLLKWSPSHFKTELTFFHVLILSAQFETAIDFLKDVSSLSVEAVHFAIALNHYGLLRTSDSIDAPMFSSDPFPTINFAQLIAGYANAFARTDTDDALEYLFLLNRIPVPNSFVGSSAMAPGAVKLSVFHIAFRDLAIETKDFDSLLLDTTSDGKRRTRGHIRRFISKDEEIKYLTCLIAEECLAAGKFDEAITLYDLASDYGKVLDLLNKELRGVLANSSVQSHHRNRIRDLAKRIVHHYENLSFPELQYKLDTLRLLRNCMEFFDLFYDQKYEQALNLLDYINILPRDTTSAGEKLSNAKLLPIEVQNNLGEIVLAGMTILFNLYTAEIQRQRSFPIKDGGSGKALQEYRTRASSLMHFAGTMSELMSGTTNARLAHMHAQMG